jgi:hypothetical protein
VEAVRVAIARVSEEKAGFIENGDFVSVFQLPSLVPTKNLFVDIGAIA